MPSSKTCRAILLAACAATLSACGGSRSPRPVLAPDPVVETRTVTRLVCPDEVTAPVPEREAPPADAAIEGSPGALDWIARRFAREELLETRLGDARAQCPLAEGHH